MTSTNNGTVFGQCRCCLSNGYHRDIMKIYYKNGVREVYYEDFMDCFNLYLSTSPKLSNLICSSCVKRLQDAREFKTLVAASERKLLSEIGDQDTLCITMPALIETVKVEPEVKIEWNDEDDPGFPGYDEDPPDYTDDKDCVDEPAPPTSPHLVEGEADLIRRFTPSPLPTREALYTICPTFAKHLDKLRGKMIRSSMIQKMLTDEYKVKTKRNDTMSCFTEKSVQVANVLVLLENSNITVFKSKNRTGFPCFYCRNSFENLNMLREHQKAHKKTDLKKLLLTYGAESLVVYADVTELKCTICDQNIPNINELKSHLIKTHKKTYNQEFSDRVIPFKLSETNVYECQLCGFSFETFGSIERHMNTHFRNYVCKDCGTGFVTKYRLKVHVKSMHVDGNFPCQTCKKVFSSHQKVKNHIDTVHKMVKRFKCPKCPERFSEYFTRQKHMVAIHGVAPLQYKCNVCDKAFDRRYTLSRHLKRDHLEERDFQCELCSYKCFTNNELRVHMVKHNGERIFECAVCKKSYARKKTLKEHLRIHNNDRRFACAVCGQAFVQKCSLKGHMKTHHAEFVSSIDQ